MTWEDYVHLAFDEIRLAGAGSPQVSRRLVAALLDLRRVALPERIEVLDEQAGLLRAATVEAMDDERDVRFALDPDREGLGAEPEPSLTTQEPQRTSARLPQRGPLSTS